MNEEVTKKYVDPVNRNVDIILIITAIVLSLAFGIIYYEYNQNEATKVKFREEEIKDITWVNELNLIEFELKDEKINFSIDATDIIKDESYELDKYTGEIKYGGNEGKLYIKSVSSESLTIWYNYAEYHLEKEKHIN